MKTNTLRALVAGSAMLPMAAFAVPPAFDATWTQNPDGTINYTCDTANYTCDTNPISDTGFMQVQITALDGSGSYFQTIVADKQGAEQFGNESFVLAGSTNGGISTKQTLMSPDTGSSGQLDSTSLINTGEFGAANGTIDTISLEQRVFTGAPATPTFDTGFIYGASTDASGVRTASMSLGQSNNVAGYTDNFRYDQSTTTSALGAVTVDALAVDISSNVELTDNGATVIGNQSFDYTLREGTAIAATTANTANLTGGTITGSGSIDWTTANSVERVLVGQGMTGIGSFGYERLATDTSSTSTFDLTSVGPFDDIVSGGADDPFTPALGALTYTTF